MVEKMTEEQRKLVVDNIGLARFLAHKRWEMAPGVLDYEELISLANQGLVAAAQRWRSYSEEKGLPEEDIVAGTGFSIFSRKRIIGAILDWQKKDADHVPRSYRTDYKIIQRAGYPDHLRDIDQLSHITGITADRIRIVTAAVERMPVSLHEFVGEDGNYIHNEPPATENVEESVVLTSVGNAIAATVEQMSQIQQVTLALRYFEGMELQSIANELDVPLTTVREAHNLAIEQVRQAMVKAISV